MYTIEINTNKRSEMIDITQEIKTIVSKSDINKGVCAVYIPHTTAGITINENADPSVSYDIITTLDNMIPWSNKYSHIEGNSAAHIKSSLLGHSVNIIIENKRLLLGTWQGIFFCEFDGPRKRKIFIKLTPC
jgi:secondary thiamine-phosphate synthase enzyme